MICELSFFKFFQRNDSCICYRSDWQRETSSIKIIWFILNFLNSFVFYVYDITKRYYQLNIFKISCSTDPFVVLESPVGPDGLRFLWPPIPLAHRFSELHNPILFYLFQPFEDYNKKILLTFFMMLLQKNWTKNHGWKGLLRLAKFGMMHFKIHQQLYCFVYLFSSTKI